MAVRQAKTGITSVLGLRWRGSETVFGGTDIRQGKKLAAPSDMESCTGPLTVYSIANKGIPKGHVQRISTSKGKKRNTAWIR